MIDDLIQKLEHLNLATTTVDCTEWPDAADAAMREAIVVLRAMKDALERTQSTCN